MSFAADLILAQDGDVVVIPLALARAIGLPAAAFLRQAAYLSAIVQKKDGWFFLEQDGPGDPGGEKIFQRLGSWQHALGIGPRAQATIRQQLMSLGLLEETRKGTVHGKLHYRVDPVKYLNFLAECGRATHCISEQTAESDCTNLAEQVHKQQDAGCTTGAPQSVIYKVDVAGRQAAAARAPARTAAAAAATPQGKQEQVRRRRGDETVHHGVEVWTPADAEGLQVLIDRHSAERVEAVAGGLTPAAGHRAPYLSAVVAAMQKLEKAEATAAASAAQQKQLEEEAARQRASLARSLTARTYFESLDESARAALLDAFAAHLTTSNSVVFQFYQRSGLKHRAVETELTKFIHSNYLTQHQQEVAA